MMVWRSTFSVVLILTIGVGAIAYGTRGLKVWTLESARRLDVSHSPVLLPKTAVLDHQGRHARLSDIDQPVVLFEFIYTRCPTICVSMGDGFRGLQNEMIMAGFADKVRLLSLSFDPEHDGPIELSNYLKRFDAKPELWSAYTFTYLSELRAVLSLLDVIVIPEPTLGFVHNAAVYVMHNHRVVKVFDHDDTHGIMEFVRSTLSQSELI